jgi:hypothetical protein
VKAIPYTTRDGRKQFKPQVGERAYRKAAENGGGFCLACGKAAKGYCEPDARKYRCQFTTCSADKVYGLEELLLMGLLTIGGK